MKVLGTSSFDTANVLSELLSFIVFHERSRDFRGRIIKLFGRIPE
jgi:hypothetical protein